MSSGAKKNRSIEGRFCRCGVAAEIAYGKSAYCFRHHRFMRMRGSARYYGKADPGLAELERLYSQLDGMKCPDCGRVMIWLKSHGRPADVITLQHYRDGTFGLVCSSCNTRHASMDGDAFCSLPADHKQCRGCNTIKPLTGFYREKRGFVKASAYCRPCHIARVMARSRKKKPPSPTGSANTAVYPRMWPPEVNKKLSERPAKVVAAEYGVSHYVVLRLAHRFLDEIAKRGVAS